LLVGDRATGSVLVTSVGSIDTVGIPADAVIRYETELRADKQLLIAHGTTADLERARALLADTNAESVEVHRGTGVPVA
jgi:hypothetical protein